MKKPNRDDLRKLWVLWLALDDDKVSTGRLLEMVCQHARKQGLDVEADDVVEALVQFAPAPGKAFV